MELKIADPTMLDALRRLDERCFPDGDPTRERATPGELEGGIENSSVLVILDGSDPIAFLQWDRPSIHHLYIAALGVDPEHQGRGLAHRLIQDFIDRFGTDQNVSVTTITSPSNAPMLRLLFAHGFVARRVMPDYFGPGKDRLYCQQKKAAEYIHPDDRYLVPSDRLPTVYELLNDERYVLTDLVDSATGQYFEVSRFEEGDRAALQAGEMSAGLTFSASILAALTFLAAFAFGSDRYPSGILALLIVAVLTSTISLIIYANASGELSRLHGNDFVDYMKWGNLLSEYGGVLPFLLALPLTFRQVTSERWAVWAVAIIFTAGIGMYERSRFALHARYPNHLRFEVLAAVTALLPLCAAAAPSTEAWMWAWTAAAIVVLTIRFLLALPATFSERSPSQGPFGLQSRR